MDNQKTIPANPDNDLMFRDQLDTKKKPDEEAGMTESTTDTGAKIEYFTE